MGGGGVAGCVKGCINSKFMSQVKITSVACNSFINCETCYEQNLEEKL